MRRAATFDCNVGAIWAKSKILTEIFYIPIFLIILTHGNVLERMQKNKNARVQECKNPKIQEYKIEESKNGRNDRNGKTTKIAELAR